MEALGIETLIKLFGEGTTTPLERLVLMALILWFVRTHFKKIENALNAVATKVGELSTNLKHLEVSHSSEISNLKGRVDKLENPAP